MTQQYQALLLACAQVETRQHDRAVRRACLLTHRDAAVVADDLPRVLEIAAKYGIELVVPEAEIDRHPILDACTVGIGDWQAIARTCDAVVVMAGDGSLLRALAHLRGGPPVLGINYGLVGYLSGTGNADLDLPFKTLASGNFRVLPLPALVATVNGVEITALNDIVASGGVTGRIIEVGWRIVTTGLDGEQRTDDMGVVPCDGMVLATPVGSTAYNLSNGGPVIAWGVDGYVVSFIAPHTLAARPLVVSAVDGVEIEHEGRGAPLKIFADGQEIGEVGSGDILNISLDRANAAQLAVIDDHSFYTRYRDSFAAAASDHVRRPRSTPVPPNSVRGSQP